MKKLALICILLPLAATNAQTIYKIIDEQGKVTYSSTPPDENSVAEAISAPPEPSQDEVDAAKQRQQALEQSLRDMQEQRKIRDQEQAEKQQQAETYIIQQQVVPVPIIREVPVIRRRPGYPVTRPYPRPGLHPHSLPASRRPLKR